MRKQIGSTILAAVLLFGTGTAWRAIAQSKADAPAQVIEMTAEKYHYTPGEVRVKQGTRVQLKVKALDHAHGFKIELYPEGAKETGDPGLRMANSQNDFKIEQNQTQVIEFVAERAGTYSFKCSVRCGWRHGSMNGKLIVE